MKLRQLAKAATACACTIALSFTTVGVASASEHPTCATHNVLQVSRYAALQEVTENQLIEVFSAIESIPDEVLAKNDSQALRSWYSSLRQDRVNWFTCGSAIGFAIISNFTPARIVKIKSAIKTVGGAVTFAKTVYSVYKNARSKGLTARTALNAAVTQAAKAAGPDVREALLDLFGIGAVMGACGIGD